MKTEIKATLNGNADDPLKHVVGLSAVWQKCISELYKSDCKELIGKEHRQLGRVRQSLGMTQAAEVVEYAIRNWGELTQRVTKQLGKDVFPQKPSVGWFCKHHAIALVMLQEKLQSAAKKKDAAEQALKEAQAKEAEKAMQESKYKQDPVTPIQLTNEQWHALIYMLDDPAVEAWVDKVTEKYGEWRPVHLHQKGIPCDIELKKAG